MAGFSEGTAHQPGHGKDFQVLRVEDINDIVYICLLRFLYSSHAEERLAERGISKHEVEEVLRQGTPKAAMGGRLKKQLMVQGRIIEIIYVRDKVKAGTYKVITVYEVE